MKTFSHPNKQGPWMQGLPMWHKSGGALHGWHFCSRLAQNFFSGLKRLQRPRRRLDCSSYFPTGSKTFIWTMEACSAWCVFHVELINSKTRYSNSHSFNLHLRCWRCRQLSKVLPVNGSFQRSRDHWCSILISSR